MGVKDPTHALVEPARLEALRDTGLLDSPNEAAFDRLTRLGARLLKAKVALVSLVDQDRQFFKSSFGLPEPWLSQRQTPLTHSFCKYVVASGEPLVVGEASKTPVLCDNLAVRTLRVEAYLGIPIRSSGGQILGSFCVIDNKPRRWSKADVSLMTELTESVMTEIELRGSLRDLRTARDAAESANQAKSDFLANVSHELRTPLNGIIGMAELVSGSLLNDEQSEYMRLLRFSAETLLDIVNDVLDLSKIEAGHFEINPGPVALREELAQGLKPLAMRAEARGLRLDLLVDETVPEGVLVDLPRLRQVLVNLVGNAIKFTQHGFVEVKVQGEGAQGDGPGDRRRILFEIADSGTGIPKDQLESVFEPFRQVVNPLSQDVKGTGLGLSIVARIVGFMGGKAYCESSLGEGSRFFFSIVVETDPAYSPPKPPSGEMPVLIWSSLPQRAQALVKLGRTFDLELESITTFPALLERAAAAEPVLLIFDVGTEDGVEKLRMLPSNPLLKVAALARPGCEPEEGWGFFSLIGHACRPLAPSELFEFVRRAQARQGLPVPPATPAPDSGGRPLRVLVVEDNRVNQRVIQAKLERLGHQVIVSDNGLQALDKLFCQTFDLILVDIQMPLMDGFEFARAVRAWETDDKPPTPIVALTAQAMTGDRERCLAAGMDGYLQKPIVSSDLMRTLEEFAHKPFFEPPRSRMS